MFLLLASLSRTFFSSHSRWLIRSRAAEKKTRKGFEDFNVRFVLHFKWIIVIPLMDFIADFSSIFLCLEHKRHGKSWKSSFRSLRGIFACIKKRHSKTFSRVDFAFFLTFKCPRNGKLSASSLVFAIIIVICIKKRYTKRKTSWTRKNILLHCDENFSRWTKV